MDKSQAIKYFSRRSPVFFLIFVGLFIIIIGTIIDVLFIRKNGVIGYFVICSVEVLIFCIGICIGKKIGMENN